MTEDSVIYTDGHGIKVTTYQFIVGEALYLIDGITSVRMNLKKAETVPAVVLVVLGMAAMAAGFFYFFSGVQINDMFLGTMALSANRLSAIIGIGLVIVGLLWLAATHTKYAVHITTAEGEKEPVVSKKKDYVNQIVSALNRALAIR